MVIVGAVSEHNEQRKPGVTVKGHIIIDYRYLNPGDIGQMVAEVGPLFAASKVRAIEQVYRGFEHVPAAFLSLFGSTKRGKAIVEL